MSINSKNELINSIKELKDVRSVLRKDTIVEMITFVSVDTKSLSKTEETYLSSYNSELNRFMFAVKADGDDDYKFISISKMVNKITEFNTEGLNFISVDYKTNKTFK